MMCLARIDARKPGASSSMRASTLSAKRSRVGGPPAFDLGRDVRVAVQRVFAGRRARRIAEALLPDDQVRPLGQPAGARLTA